MRSSSLALMILALATPALAQDEGYRNGRIRYLEQGTLLQRADEGTSEEAGQNMPFLPGDRLWTDESGRVELQFDDGSFVRLDERSKLDYLGNDRADTVALKLWSGSLYLHTRPEASGFTIETPGGTIETVERGVYRIDVRGGEVALSVYEGEATLDSGRRRVSVEAGERSDAQRGEWPERGRRFERGDRDDFARWDEDREDRTAYAGDGRRYLPDDVLPYASDLDANGSWYYEAEVGHVWRPYVAAGWRPYSSGRWVWTAYGWTWVPNESWGWAPSHYGRWGNSAALGWYWIPGNVWGPAWVSWAVGGDYIGWCPLGQRDRPVIVGDRHRGYAVPRGSIGAGSIQTVGNAVESRAWVFARRGDLARPDLAKRRIDATPTELREVKVLDSPRLRPTRDLRVAEVHGMTAPVKTKPTIGDVVPELRSDPKTTIPRPIVAQPRRDPDRDVRPRGPVVDPDRAPGAVRGQPVLPRDSGDRGRVIDRYPPSDRERDRSTDRDRRDDDRVRPSDPDREILRRVFEPVNQQPRRGGDERDSGSGGVRPRDPAPRGSAPQDSRPRSEHRTAAPPRAETPRHTTPPPTNTAKPRDKEH